LGGGASTYGQGVRPGQPPMTLWGETWRVLLAALVGILLWLSAWFGLDAEGRTGPVWWLAVADPLLGVASLVLLRFRRRWPVPVAAVLVLLSAVVTTAAGVCMIAIISVATRRHWRELAVIVPLYLASSFVWDEVFTSS